MQYELDGPGVSDFLERVTPSSVGSLKNHRSTLSCFLDEETGGIIDDTVLARLADDRLYFVTNAGTRTKVNKHLRAEIDRWNEVDGKPAVALKQLPQHGLLALQGPHAVALLKPLLERPQDNILRDLYFGQSIFARLRLPDGTLTSQILVSRGGYTGEDGVELSIPSPEETRSVAHLLLDASGEDKLRLAGLAARDSLRLEAGMCLYGHDMDENTTPVEASLTWIIGRDRRTPDTATFHGAQRILQQLRPRLEGGGVERRRVGLIVSAPAREGKRIIDRDGHDVGVVTSGGPSPTFGKNIAMGYVRYGSHKNETALGVDIRGKVRDAWVTKMPFINVQYHKAPRPASVRN